VHDIGKIGISDQILHKSGPLSDKEWETMRGHPAIGEQMLLPYRQFRHQALIVRSHHERWDGRGYPDNLRGQSIPISARIIGVADAFDAMTSTRPYRPAMSRARAIEEIRKNAAIQFDPMVVASFLQVMEEADKIRPITAVLDQAGEADGPWYSSLP
jgi:HD-GYP domain-containing protein (c-di-GMP phosphodiesterase class II)